MNFTAWDTPVNFILNIPNDTRMLSTSASLRYSRPGSYAKYLTQWLQLQPTSIQYFHYVSIGQTFRWLSCLYSSYTEETFSNVPQYVQADRQTDGHVDMEYFYSSNTRNYLWMELIKSYKHIGTSSRYVRPSACLSVRHSSNHWN